jgi:hypothetical protein
MIRVYVCEPYNKQEERMITGELTEQQEIVGGFIEVATIGNYSVVCNEEGRIKEFTPSVHLDFPIPPIFGTCFFTKFENGEMVSLSDLDIQKIKKFMAGEPATVLA